MYNITFTYSKHQKIYIYIEEKKEKIEERKRRKETFSKTKCLERLIDTSKRRKISRQGSLRKI